MSTRASIVIIDDKDKLFFYRHSDGYPSGVRPTLSKLLDLINEGAIRNNLSQFSGWLVLIGAWEQNTIPVKGDTFTCTYEYVHSQWKVGSYEPIKGITPDSEYVYEFDLIERTIKAFAHEYDYEKDKSNLILLETWT